METKISGQVYYAVIQDAQSGEVIKKEIKMPFALPDDNDLSLYVNVALPSMTKVRAERDGSELKLLGIEHPSMRKSYLLNNQ